MNPVSRDHVDVRNAEEPVGAVDDAALVRALTS
jgi:hypothetical protein